MVRNNEERQSATVKSIHTDYVRSLEQKVNRKKAQKVRLYRRLTVFAIAAVIILSVLTMTFVNQKSMLAAKEQEKETLLVELAEVNEEKLLLTGQIAKLNDDEYIAKLAREQYFLSDKNEIIFSMPKTKGKDEKKDGEKE